ncbi:MAG: methyltransferase domain-containing protein [Candidatus Aenigmarchaeota archaeon]|nr:methyltransferase domain-containing protein [Candidatus Aenigmarchaeota archaeon]
MKRPSNKEWLENLNKFYIEKADVYEKLANAEDYRNDIFKQTVKIFNPRGKVILDMGCGTGKYAIPFSKTAERVYAVDMSKGMLKILKNKIKKKNIKSVKIIKSDYGKINLSKESIDLIFSTWSFPAHSKRWASDLSKLRKIIRKGGYMILVDNYHGGEFWEIRKLVTDLKKDFCYGLDKWMLSKGFNRKIFDVLLEFKTKKRVRDVCGAFYGPSIAGYILGKGKTWFRMRVAMWYWKKE